MNSKKSALVLGATGLVGQQLIHLLLKDGRYSKITALVRQPIPDVFDPDNKLQCVRLENTQEQDPWQAYLPNFQVNHVYVCLGTTIKKAGSQQAFRHVDYELIVRAAHAAASQSVDSFVYISSVDANPSSSNFYLRVKGQTEQAISAIPTLHHAVPVRPSLLIGQRNETRLAEQIGIGLARFFSPLLLGSLKKYRPVHAVEVAQQMISLQKFK